MSGKARFGPSESLISLHAIPLPDATTETGTEGSGEAALLPTWFRFKTLISHQTYVYS